MKKPHLEYKLGKQDAEIDFISSYGINVHGLCSAETGSDEGEYVQFLSHFEKGNTTIQVFENTKKAFEEITAYFNTSNTIETDECDEEITMTLFIPAEAVKLEFCRSLFAIEEKKEKSTLINN